MANEDRTADDPICLTWNQKCRERWDAFRTRREPLTAENAVEAIVLQLTKDSENGSYTAHDVAGWLVHYTGHNYENEADLLRAINAALEKLEL